MARAASSRFPSEWFSRSPTPERIKGVMAAADQGWGPVAADLYNGATGAFEHGQNDAAEAWFYVAAWSDLFGQSQAVIGRRWLESVEKAYLLNVNVPSDLPASLPDEPLAKLLSTEMIAWLLGERAFSAAFFNQLSPYDYLPGVVANLRLLREADPRRFASYAQLAMAIALVYDSPPPPSWPHGQVTAKVLPRMLPRPLDAFNFFVDSDLRGATLQKLGTLAVSDLKFMVDLAAPFSELLWAQKSVRCTLDQFPQSYSMVRYRTYRLQAKTYLWPGDSYDLPGIFSEGGICVDQAYFATQAGKARGVPTLLFSGDGLDGRHAWFGYLGSNQKWVLDAGRYAEQRFVTGVAYDPQTWAELSDHDLKFLSEGFRKLPPYQQSRQQELFAAHYLQMGQKKEAAATARKAVNYERRNLDAWDILIAASVDTDIKTREALLREAAMALQLYPDLNAHFVRLLATSLRSHGQTSEADFEERSIAHKNKSDRSDLGVEQAAEMIARVIGKNTPILEQLHVYRQVLEQYGQGSGMAFYDQVVRPFVGELVRQGRSAEAKGAVMQARAVLKPEPDSQMDVEMKTLLKGLR